MKHSPWIIIGFIITISTLTGSLYYFSSIPANASEAKLNINNLTAFTNGKVSFNVILSNPESEVLETVIVNNTSYSWSDGSNENSTILKSETKHWSINISNLQNGTNLDVIVETPSSMVKSNTTVKSLPNHNPNPDDPKYVFDTYGGVGLFGEGIHVVATSQDPTKIKNDFLIENNFWKMLAEHEIITGTDQDFISIILSRGDKNTGGYTINVESFGWLESYPAKFRFHINFTDPSEGVAVTQALTNPLVLVPIGKLTPGEYHIEVPITQFILNFDKDGNPYYTQIQTFAPVIWKQTLIIKNSENPTPLTVLNVILNGNEAQDLIVQVDLSDGLSEEEAKKITDVAFYKTLGDKLHRLDTITYDDEHIIAHYTWGYDENDTGHIFDVTVDLTSLKMTINHCF